MEPDDLDSNKKKQQPGRLASMQMPQAAAAPAEQDGTFIDPYTGQPTKEEGIEEGELYQDYVMPVKTLFMGGLKAAGKMALDKAGKEGGKALKDRLVAPIEKKEQPSLDYAAMKEPRPADSGKSLQYRQGGYNGQMGAGNTTDATNGFLPKKPRGT